SGTPVTAVQIGDAITQKVMLDYIFEMGQKNWIKAITDNGGGGLSSSMGEIARISGGVDVDLKKVPLKYHGLQPWEIFISESQERMTFVIDPVDLDKVMELAKKRDVEVSVIGKFTDSGYLNLLYGSQKVAQIEMEFLHEGLPKKEIIAEWKKPKHVEPDFDEPELVLLELKKLLSALNICSKEYIVRPYDHEVKGRTIIKPLSGVKNDGPSDASVMAPKLDSREALVIGHGLCPRYSDIDAYHMSACAFDEMVRNIIATGGKITDLENDEVVMWSINDNFCTPDSIYDEIKNPDGKLKFANIVRANKALYDYTTAYNIPCTSGKDSMKNDYKYIDENGESVRIAVPLTLLYSGACKIKDYRKCVTIDFKKSGDLVYILGETKKELGAGEYFNLHGFIGNDVPKVDADSAIKMYKSVGRAMDDSFIESCHDCSDGGLGIALAESAFSGGLGADIDLSKISKKGIDRNDHLLFSESQSRFVVSIKPENKVKFEEMMEGNVFSEVGKVIDEPMFIVKKLNQEIEKIGLQILKESWQKLLRFDLPLENIR
ncbi:phosphoribosylformylglycinamidine synthase, partial [archaeon]|nr:phosphoribosylformylglycinamidine synthase [archaeon]